MCLQSLEESSFTLTYMFSSPLLRGVTLLEKWRVNEGKKPARRAKLYYLEDRQLNEYFVA